MLVEDQLLIKVQCLWNHIENIYLIGILKTVSSSHIRNKLSTVNKRIHNLKRIKILMKFTEEKIQELKNNKVVKDNLLSF